MLCILLNVHTVNPSLVLSPFVFSWVICEHSNYRGRQFLLEPIEITNWLKFSSLETVGSLYPVRQVCELYTLYSTTSQSIQMHGW